MQPVRLRLPRRGARIGIVGCAQYSDEDVCLTDLTRELIDDRYGGAGIVDEQFLAGTVNLAHGAFERGCVVVMQLAELGIAVGGNTSIGFDILFPQQLQGDAFLVKLATIVAPEFETVD